MTLVVAWHQSENTIEYLFIDRYTLFTACTKHCVASLIATSHKGQAGVFPLRMHMIPLQEVSEIS